MRQAGVRPGPHEPDSSRSRGIRTWPTLPRDQCCVLASVPDSICLSPPGRRWGWGGVEVGKVGSAGANTAGRWTVSIAVRASLRFDNSAKQSCLLTIQCRHTKLRSLVSVPPSSQLVHDRLPDAADVAQLGGQLCCVRQAASFKRRRQLLHPTRAVPYHGMAWQGIIKEDLNEGWLARASRTGAT